MAATNAVDPAHRHGDREPGPARGHPLGDEGEDRPEDHHDRPRHLHLRPGTPPTPPASATAAGWAPTDPSVLLGQELLELWADGQRVAWRPVTGTSACAGDHAYTATFTPAKNGPLRFAVLDLDHRDNAGTLAVTLSR